MPGKTRSFTLAHNVLLEMVEVPAGHFFIGDTTHQIQVPSFHLAKYPVTQALWLAVMGGENPAYFKGSNRPVEQVSWYDAAAFCNALNEQCGYAPPYFADEGLKKPLDITMTLSIEYPETIPVFIDLQAAGFRLPSEALWEYAAIGARPRAVFTYAGGNNLDELGWYRENSHNQTQPVGLKLPNELGLYDLSGNVWEWCEDQYQNNSEKIPQDASPWLQGEKGSYRVLRGGSWINNAPYCRPSRRGDNNPSDRYDLYGFRVVLCFPPGRLSEKTSP